VFTRNGDYEIFYDTDGEPSGRPLLLVCGLTQQCIGWPQGLVDAFVAAGFYAIRYDNRDVGLSGKSAAGASYLLSDMAADGIAVLDALGIDAAHVWGASMGGMLAQTLAIEHPSRVLTLTSVMSTTGDEKLLQDISPDMVALLMTPPPEGRDASIESDVAAFRAFSGPHFDEAVARTDAALAYDRCHYPQGAAAQLQAITTSGDRTEALHGVAIPSTVIHGRLDPLLPLPGGEATAAAIKDARLVVLDEMAHDLPQVYWPVYVNELVALTERAAAR
jgi:pimeloyl-ACP methyl ester carboxylesterase